MAEIIVNGKRVTGVVTGEESQTDEVGSHGSLTISRSVRASAPRDATKMPPLRGAIFDENGNRIKRRRRPNRATTRSIYAPDPVRSTPLYRF